MSNKGEVHLQEGGELAHAIAGAGAGALSIVLTYPLVTIATKLQIKDRAFEGESKKNTSANAIIQAIYETDGLSGFYAGLESAVYGMAVTNFVYYYFYELTGRSVQKFRHHDRLSTLESVFTGAIAGTMTAIASNPIWIANTRMTVTKSEKSTLSMILQIIKEDGFLSLFNGLKPALVLVLNPIIQYTVFEQLKNLILKRQKNRQATLSPSWAFVLGALGKLVATGSTYPYITLKTRLHMAGENKIEGLANDTTSPEKLTMLSATINIIRKNGIAGLYRGIGYKLVQSILTAAFLFFFKEGFVLWSLKVLRIFRQFIALRKGTFIRGNIENKSWTK